MPLVLHNVPDDELYVGKDGVTRPFAVVGPVDDRRSARLRRQASASHGSFGRTRSRASAAPGGAAARGKQQQGKTATTTSTTHMAADEMFGMWKKEQEMLQHGQQQQQHQQHQLSKHRSQEDLLGDDLDVTAPVQQQQQQPSSLFQKPQNQPTEVVLRGYRSADYQYAALSHYEQIAGRICEDYPRDPPVGSRRYRSSLRDGAAQSAATLASNGRSALTPAERQAVMQRAASGQHWVKVTFESAQAAEAALHASPQVVLGYLVTAELYRGVPLPASEDIAIPDPETAAAMMHEYEYEDVASSSLTQGRRGGRGFRAGSAFSGASSRTVDSGTVTNDDGGFSGGAGGSGTTVAGSTTSSVRTVPGGLGRRQPWASAEVDEMSEVKEEEVREETSAPPPENTEFCRRIPTARRATLKAPELALLPRESALKRFVQRLPLLNRLTGTIIGNQVPRRDNGLFDWDKASLYWKLIWWLDFLFALFGGEILDANKED